MSNAHKAQDHDPGEATLSVLLRHWTESVHTHVINILDLLTLETRYSIWNIGLALCLLLMAVIGAISLWAVILAAIVTLLLETGRSWVVILLLMGALNLGMMITALLTAQSCLSRVGYDRSKRVIGLGETDHEDV